MLTLGNFGERLGDLLLDGLQTLGHGIAGSVSFLLGLLGSVVVGSIPSLMELADDLTTFKGDMIEWPHVIKIMAAGVLPAVGTYIGGRSRIQTALMTPVPHTGPKKKAKKKP